MTEEIKKITKKFNDTVKKGSLFQINYYSDVEDWQDLQVISGHATIVKDVVREPGDRRYNQLILRADEADKDGNIVIAVTGHHRNNAESETPYKIHVV